MFIFKKESCRKMYARFETLLNYKTDFKTKTPCTPNLNLYENVNNIYFEYNKLKNG